MLAQEVVSKESSLELHTFIFILNMCTYTTIITSLGWRTIAKKK